MLSVVINDVLDVELGKCEASGHCGKTHRITFPWFRSNLFSRQNVFTAHIVTRLLRQSANEKSISLSQNTFILCLNPHEIGFKMNKKMNVFGGTNERKSSNQVMTFICNCILFWVCFYLC